MDPPVAGSILGWAVKGALKFPPYVWRSSVSMCESSLTLTCPDALHTHSQSGFPASSHINPLTIFQGQWRDTRGWKLPSARCSLHAFVLKRAEEIQAPYRKWQIILNQSKQLLVVEGERCIGCPEPILQVKTRFVSPLMCPDLQ